MIRDIQQYWREIRQIEATLDDFVWLAPAHPKPIGKAVEVHPVEVPGATAAHLLHQKSHRVATKEEVEAHRAREAGLALAAKKERLRREGRTQVLVPSTKDG